jgi:hypothetical protein
MKKLVSQANHNKIKRISICSAWGVGDTKNDIPFWFKWLIKNSKIKIAYDDHEKQESILINSKLEWTIVRPVGLTNSMKFKYVKETFNNEPKPNLTISRQALAQYLIDSLSNEELRFKKVVISE